MYEILHLLYNAPTNLRVKLESRRGPLIHSEYILIDARDVLQIAIFLPIHQNEASSSVSSFVSYFIRYIALKIVIPN